MKNYIALIAQVEKLKTKYKSSNLHVIIGDKEEVLSSLNEAYYFSHEKIDKKNDNITFCNSLVKKDKRKDKKHIAIFCKIDFVSNVSSLNFASLFNQNFLDEIFEITTYTSTVKLGFNRVY